ncbi:hypothetical protein AMJ47_01650 [Parcubacteria bacterium DG_72]|nr:MAG: hypothetical protein AMJ47_01650 [Parcubacteria bacterium DG_72]
MSKKVLIIFILLIGVLTACQVLAMDLWGWAYSEIGWVSFNCNNDYDGDGTREDHCAISGYVDYGVDVDDISGEFSGYAWSENIGWISFEPASVAGCDHFVPAGATSCQAYIDFLDSKIYGWARACSVFDSGCSGTVTSTSLGGWSGWIKFDGADSWYKTHLDNAPTPSELREWGWGDNVVIGWVSLNNIDAGAVEDYEVKTDLKLNNLPVASFICVPASCQVYRGEALILDNVSTDSDGSITLSEWYQDGVPLYSCSLPADPLCDNTYGTTRGQWDVKLYVEDDKAASDETLPQTVTVLRDIVASFQCSLDGITWLVCPAIMPVEGDTLYLKDTSSPSEISFGNDAVVNIWSWEIDGINVGNTSEIEYEGVIPSMIIKLTVTDSNGRTGSKEEPLGGVMPLPTWREIPPF